MTKNEKILKRALEMAVKAIIEKKTCEDFSEEQEMDVENCAHKFCYQCEIYLRAVLIRKAKEELK